MMSKELMDKILDGRDIMKDVKSFVLPDMMKIITLIIDFKKKIGKWVHNLGE